MAIPECFVFFKFSKKVSFKHRPILSIVSTKNIKEDIASANIRRTDSLDIGSARKAHEEAVTTKKAALVQKGKYT